MVHEKTGSDERGTPCSAKISRTGALLFVAKAMWQWIGVYVEIVARLLPDRPLQGPKTFIGVLVSVG